MFRTLKLRAIVLFGLLLAYSVAGHCPDKSGAIDAHNGLRKDYGLNPLNWRSTLEEAAQAWADHLASKGECAAMSSGEPWEILSISMAHTTCVPAIESWFSEPDNNMALLSADITEMGCATADIDDGICTIVVCRYGPTVTNSITKTSGMQVFDSARRLLSEQKASEEASEEMSGETPEETPQDINNHNNDDYVPYDQDPMYKKRKLQSIPETSEETSEEISEETSEENNNHGNDDYVPYDQDPMYKKRKLLSSRKILA